MGQAYIISLDEYQLIGTHWIDLHVNNDNIIYFDSFGVEHIPERIKKFIEKNNDKYLWNTSIGFNNVWMIIQIHFLFTRRMIKY